MDLEGPTVNLRRLESFVLVAQGESVTGAARRLGFAQSSLSGHLNALEETLRRIVTAIDKIGFHHHARQKD